METTTDVPGNNVDTYEKVMVEYKVSAGRNSKTTRCIFDLNQIFSASLAHKGGQHFIEYIKMGQMYKHIKITSKHQIFFTFSQQCK